MQVFTSVLEGIGKTPLAQITNIDTGCCELFVKLESLNPGGSIKDRIALYLIDDAEQRGLIQPGDTLIEATAGNTGVGLALVAGQKGYGLKVVMPDKMSREKVYCLQAMGAEVILTRSDVGKGHPEYYQDFAQNLALQNGYYYVNQFCNSANVRAHYETTGPEIWQQMEHNVDCFVCGVGTGGTLSGAGGYLKEKNRDLEIVLADPEGSILASMVETGQPPDSIGSWFVEGIGEDFVPDNCRLDLVTRAYSVNDRDAFSSVKDLLQKEGIMGGSSTGTLFSAALRYCRQQSTPKRVVSFVCDTGNRYLSKVYNEEWINDNLY